MESVVTGDSLRAMSSYSACSMGCPIPNWNTLGKYINDYGTEIQPDAMASGFGGRASARRSENPGGRACAPRSPVEPGVSEPSGPRAVLPSVAAPAAFDIRPEATIIGERRVAASSGAMGKHGKDGSTGAPPQERRT